jgi:hypothetical protein
MKKNIALFLIGLLTIGVGANSVAEHVKGYTKKDGTYVAPYERGSTRTTKPSKSPAAKAPTHETAPSTPPSVARDSNGHIKRSSSAKHEFEKTHPCPSTHKTSGACPGYVVDHVIALKRGGADAPSNMQWQTVEAAKAKDKVE